MYHHLVCYRRKSSTTSGTQGFSSSRTRQRSSKGVSIASRKWVIHPFPSVHLLSDVWTSIVPGASNGDLQLQDRIVRSKKSLRAQQG